MTSGDSGDCSTSHSTTVLEDKGRVHADSIRTSNNFSFSTTYNNKNRIRELIVEVHAESLIQIEV